MTSREVGASRSTRRTRAHRRPVRPLSPFIRALRPGHFFGPTDGTNHARRAVCNVHATRPPLGVVHWPLSLISPLTFTVCQAFVSTRSLQIVRLPSTPDEAARRSVGRSTDVREFRFDRKTHGLKCTSPRYGRSRAAARFLALLARR